MISQNLTWFVQSPELNDLTGFVAAEANHASSKREEQELSDIFEILESNLLSIQAR
jgi:hypothetical protein